MDTPDSPRPYLAPVLTDIGRVRDLTAGQPIDNGSTLTCPEGSTLVDDFICVPNGPVEQ